MLKESRPQVAMPVKLMSLAGSPSLTGVAKKPIPLGFAIEIADKSAPWSVTPTAVTMIGVALQEDPLIALIFPGTQIPSWWIVELRPYCWPGKTISLFNGYMSCFGQ